MGDDRALSGAVAVLTAAVLIAAGGGGAAARAATGDTTGAGLPKTTFGVVGDGGLPLERDRATGRASVVMSGVTDVVVVTATDGAYHRVHLPGYHPELYDAGAPGIALSPDGTRLVYGWHASRPTGPGALVPGGPAVLDLDSGSVRRLETRQLADADRRRGLVAWGFRWSPNSRYVAFDAAAVDPASWLGWTRDLSSRSMWLLDTTTSALSAVGPGARLGDDPSTLVATPTGEVVRVIASRNGRGYRCVTWDGAQQVRSIESASFRTAQLSADGRWLALAQASLTVVSRARGIESGWAVMPRGPRRLWDGTGEALGWTAPDQVLVLVHTRTGPATFSRDAELVTVTLEPAPAPYDRDLRRPGDERVETQLATASAVGRVVTGDPGTVFSFATDLAAGGQPTRHFDPPGFVGAEPDTTVPATTTQDGAPVPRADDPTVPLTWVLLGASAGALIAAAVTIASYRRRARWSAAS